MKRIVLFIAGIALLTLAACRRELVQETGGVVGFAVSETIPDLRTKAETAPWSTQAGDYILTASEQWLPLSGADTKASKIYRSADSTPLQGDPIAVWAYNMPAAGSAVSAWLVDGGSPAPVQANYNSSDAKWVSNVIFNSSKRAASYYTRWFAVAPWSAIGGGATVSTLADGQAPVLSYTVPSAVSEQHDLMVATPTTARAIDDKSDIPLEFQHVLTGVRIKTDKESNLTKAVLSGVYNTGTFDLLSGSWEVNTSVTGSFTADLSSASVWDRSDADYDFVKDGGMFMMVPQWLPAGAKLILFFDDGKIVEADISGHEWKMGKLVTYKVAADQMTEAPWSIPLTVEPFETGTTTITIPNGKGYTFKWSIDGGAKQESFSDPIVIDAEQGQKVELYHEGAVRFPHGELEIPGEEEGEYYRFDIGIQFSKPSYVYGNVMSLASETDFASISSCISSQFAFLFANNDKLHMHPEKELLLPATTLAGYCYESMFLNCTSLTSAPALPATTMENGCYQNMFENCTSLISAPDLPATTLAKRCYMGMFYHCDSLISAPDLPATTLAESCYHTMFIRCNSLTKAPDLPATTLARGCYQSMFVDCKSLTETPDLPATIMEPNCYYSMFAGCSALTSFSVLPATTLAEYCYANMFSACTSLIAAPDILATTLAPYCCYFMFYRCTSMTSAPAVLPATTMAESCYQSMFQGCTSLTSAPALPATTLAKTCYRNMFRNCTSLASAPALPATTLAEGCYALMFCECSSLTTPPTMLATTLAPECCIQMFIHCTSLTTAPVLYAEKSEDFCYSGMFNSCKSLKEIECNLLDTSAKECTSRWVDGVAANGTFKKNASSSWSRGFDGIPYSWTIVDIE